MKNNRPAGRSHFAGSISCQQSHGVVSWTIVRMGGVLLSTVKSVTEIPVVGIGNSSSSRLVNEFDNARTILLILRERGKERHLCRKLSFLAPIALCIAIAALAIGLAAACAFGSLPAQHQPLELDLFSPRPDNIVEGIIHGGFCFYFVQHAKAIVIKRPA